MAWLAEFLQRISSRVATRTIGGQSAQKSGAAVFCSGVNTLFSLADWLRGLDLNQRPLGYEPNELPGCSTPQYQFSNTPGGGQTIILPQPQNAARRSHSVVRSLVAVSVTLLAILYRQRGITRMSQLYVVVLAVIVVALLAVAVARSFFVKTKADYLVAGGSLPG